MENAEKSKRGGFSDEYNSVSESRKSDSEAETMTVSAKKNPRGGKRAGAGRPKGAKNKTSMPPEKRTKKTKFFPLRITPEEVVYLKKCLEEYRNNGGF